MSSVNGAVERADFAGINALSSRAAGYAVAKKCLEVQHEAEQRDPSLRTDRRVVLHEDARSWYTGALGEIEVGRMLTALGPEWFVRHAVPIGAGTKDVDHLVIGPGGVFAINTKHHIGAKIWVVEYTIGIGNTKVPYLSAATRDGIDVCKRLSANVDFAVTVRPVIAVLNPQSLVDRRDANNRPVAVIEAGHLVTWLQRQPQQLSNTKLSLLKLAAEDPGIWHRDPHLALTLRVMPRFERLVEQTGGSFADAPATHHPARRKSSTPRPTRPGRTQGKKRRGWLSILWGWIGLAFAASLIFSLLASAGCSPVVLLNCLAPSFTQGLASLAFSAVGFSVWAGLIASLVWAISRLRRK